MPFRHEVSQGLVHEHSVPGQVLRLGVLNELGKTKLQKHKAANQKSKNRYSCFVFQNYFCNFAAIQLARLGLGGS